MPPPSLSTIFDFGLDALEAIVDATTNAIILTLGDSTSGRASSKGVELVQHTGFASMPAPATAGSPSCQYVTIKRGGIDVAIASKDVRACDRYANLKPGEACMYATVGQARVLCKADGTVTLYTTDTNDKAGKSVFFRIHPTDGFQFVAPWGTFSFDKTGWHVRHFSGFRLDAGGVGGLPGPLSILGTYFNVTSSIIKMGGSMVLLGAGPVYNPATYGLAENPLTSPMVPILSLFPGAPTGLVTSTSVRISAT